MRDSVFVEVEFFLLVLFSIVLPVSMYGYMMWKRAISRKTVLLFGFMLVAKSGVTIFLLQRLATMAKSTPSLLDDRIFNSDFSIALYFVPILFAGIGVNMLSHVLISHLADAERRFDRERTENSFAEGPMGNSGL
jgi:hypothetical protein